MSHCSWGRHRRRGTAARARARELRKAGLDAIAAAADSAGQETDFLLADTALGHADPAVREEAIHALGERGGGLALQTLQQTLLDPDSRIRHATIRALTGAATLEATRIIGGALSSKEASLRLDAVEALGEIGNPEAAPHMQQMLGDESQPIRDAAAQWLAELAEEGRLKMRNSLAYHAAHQPER